MTRVFSPGGWALAAALVSTLVPQPPAARAGTGPAPVVISIVGTNDLHGHVEVLPMLGGFIGNLRRIRREAGGGVLLVDAGDLFQGTLPSNIGEGAAVIAAYNVLGYAAAAIGNHEFDFGPVGPATIAAGASDDPRGALRARAREARFPLLAANVIDRTTRQPWVSDNIQPDALVPVAGVMIGLVGVTTMSTPTTTLPPNFTGLRMAGLAGVVEKRAADLRQRGADLVVLLAHAGASCRIAAGSATHDASALAACDERGEIFALAWRLPTGSVDVIVAGHTHAAVAHVVNGISIVESYAYGKAFGRVDVTLARRTGANEKLGRFTKLSTRVFPPRELCLAMKPAVSPPDCDPGRYEGRTVVPEAAIARAIAPALLAARRLQEKPLGVTVEGKIKRSYGSESALGNLVTDLMRLARPLGDVAITNGGGLRRDLPAGPLHYGTWFEMMPFDNTFARLDFSGADLKNMITGNLRGRGGFLSVSGVRARITCVDGTPVAELVRDGGRNDGRPIADEERLVGYTNDFLARGGDPYLTRFVRDIEIGPTIRDATAAALTRLTGPMTAKRFFARPDRRIDFPGRRPLRCP